MVDEITLVNQAFYKYKIQPFKVHNLVRHWLRDGIIFSPRDNQYMKV